MIQIPFQQWFTFHNLIGGDWRFFWPENLKEILSYSLAWDSSLNTGIGKDNFSFLWLNSYVAYFSNFLTQILHIPWNIAEKLMFFWPIVLISFFSAFFISKTFLKNKFLNILSGIIYLTNTYALMIFSGGQVGLALAYSLAPLVFARFIKISNLKLSVIAGLVLALQILFDLRIAYVTLFALVIYFLFNVKRLIIGKDLKEIVVNIFYIFIIPLVVSGLLHAFWILPLLVFHQNPVEQLSSAYNSIEAVRFFSFAKLENTISLLHPNWPENIFGKVGFMKPEFLLLPILAFSSLFFISNTKDKRTKSYVLFFAILGLTGAFLAKGANDPFGGLYVWMFSHIPGFIMFRDPTKWHTLVAISYSILIPFSIWNIYDILNSKFKSENSKVKFQIQKYIPNVFLIFITLYLLFLIRPALLGQLTGTFKATKVPNDYTKLEKFLSSQETFSRTFWIPSWQRFGYFSNSQPAIGREEIFKGNSKKQIQQLKEIEVDSLLRDLSVKYIVVPYDSESEIFLKDREYDDKQYKEAIKEIQNLPWVKKIDGFGRIAVFEISSPKDHFWSPSTSLKINYKFLNPTKYTVKVENAKKGDILVFSESFDKYWIAKSQISPASPSEAGRANFKSQRYHDLFNSFKLEKGGDYSFEVYYEPQKWVDIGVVISLVTLISVLGFLGFGLMGRKW